MYIFCEVDQLKYLKNTIQFQSFNLSLFDDENKGTKKFYTLANILFFFKI